MLSSIIDRLRETATWFEVAWTVPALLALVLRIWLLTLVTGDVRYWHRAHRREPDRDLEAEMIWADSQFWHKVVLVTCLALMAGFGLVAMLTPPVVRPAPRPTRVTYALTFVFLAIPILLAVDGIQTLINRRRTRHADDERTLHQRRRRDDVPIVQTIAEQIDQEMK